MPISIERHKLQDALFRALVHRKSCKFQGRMYQKTITVCFKFDLNFRFQGLGFQKRQGSTIGRTSRHRDI